MIKLNRVCIPFGLKCNLSCQYCYRDISRRNLPEDLNELMKNYLKFISPEWCEALVASGGEPLLYWKKIKNVFEIAESKIHKKIMTNGLLLTDKMVEYCNKRNIEVQISHDGSFTKELRGIDVLEDPIQKEIIKKVNILRIVSVATNKNCNVIENYKDTVKKLDGRQNFIFDPCPVFDTPKNDHLIKGFNYEGYRKSMIEYFEKYQTNTPFYERKSNKRFPAGYGYNVDLHGNIICTEKLTKYGTVLDDKKKLFAAAEKSGDGDACNRNVNCAIRGECCGIKTQASPHVCKILMIERMIEEYFSR